MLTLEALFATPPPGEVVLGANFPTKDPVAKVMRQREYRKLLDREQGLTP